jgi:hypothetical protein
MILQPGSLVGGHPEGESMGLGDHVLAVELVLMKVLSTASSPRPWRRRKCSSGSRST